MTIVGIRFKRAGRVYYFDPSPLGDAELPYGTAVIVETGRGAEFGRIAIERREIDTSELIQPVRKLIRLANPVDNFHKSTNPGREESAKEVCRAKIVEHGLQMDLVAAEMNYDSTKIVFYFTSEGRVDFRELVKDLATTLRIRIELRQIGVRDEAKIVSGMGACGRELCCAAFLSDFSPISIKTAKDQGLSLNPTKISGCCGKLMCCLKYEEATYTELIKTLPGIGTAVQTPDGSGEVVGLGVLRQMVKVSIRAKGDDERSIKQYAVGDITYKGCAACDGDCAKPGRPGKHATPQT